MGNEHVDSLRLHGTMTMFPQGSACVYIAHVLDRGHQNDLTMTKINDGQIDKNMVDF